MKVDAASVKNVHVIQYHFERAGERRRGHTHAHDHLTLLAHGALRVTVNGAGTEFRAPAMIWIKATERHDLEALEDGTVAYCVHALRHGPGADDIIDPAMVPDGVSMLNYSQPLRTSN